MQAVVQKYTDGSVSKTVNLPKDIDRNDFSELLLEYAKDLKGVTCYRDGCKGSQPLNYISEAETLKHLSETSEGVAESACPTGKCSI